MCERRLDYEYMGQYLTVGGTVQAVYVMRTLPPIPIAVEGMPNDTVLLCPPIPAELFRDWPAEHSIQQAKMMRDYAMKCLKITGLKQ